MFQLKRRGRLCLARKKHAIQRGRRKEREEDQQVRRTKRRNIWTTKERKGHGSEGAPKPLIKVQYYPHTRTSLDARNELPKS